jgi:hypothetical protein
MMRWCEGALPWASSVSCTPWGGAATATLLTFESSYALAAAASAVILPLAPRGPQCITKSASTIEPPIPLSSALSCA